MVILFEECLNRIEDGRDSGAVRAYVRRTVNIGGIVCPSLTLLQIAIIPRNEYSLSELGQNSSSITLIFIFT